MEEQKTQQKREQLVKRLRQDNNFALSRLAEAVAASQSHQNIDRYSRMHHRHNRSTK